jgi:hypothetical protein
MKVPQNKVVYFGARKWVAGQPLPPFLSVKMEEPEIKEVKTTSRSKKASKDSEDMAF